MNKNDVIQNMVKFIEDKDVVKSILDKLDEEIENENK